MLAKGGVEVIDNAAYFRYFTGVRGHNALYFGRLKFPFKGGWMVSLLNVFNDYNRKFY